MKLALDCIPCFQRQALQASRFSAASEELQGRVVREVMSLLLTLDWSTTPPLIARQVHRIVRDVTQNSDPYLSVKRECNRKALELYPDLRSLVDESTYPLENAVKLSIAGNIIDFGAKESFDLRNTIEEVLGSELTVNDIDSLKRDLRTARTIALLADNAGEIVFDRIMLETIIHNHPNVQKVTLVVKGEPTINDAMREDVEEVGLTSLPQVEVFDEGVGMGSRQDPEFLEMIKDHDIVLSKGMGNYEGLSDQTFIYFLLMVKCGIVSSDIGLPVGSTVLKAPTGE